MLYWLRELAERRLTRVTSGRAYIREIDALRFVAITWVLLFHIAGSTPGRGETKVSLWLLEPLTDLYASGHFGVSLFFAISGFVLALPFARQHLGEGRKVRLRPYFARRVTRLEPPYLIHVLLLSALFAVTWRTGWIWPRELLADVEPIPFMVRHNAASLFYLHNVTAGYPNPLNVVLWSLEVEVQFYVVMPMLANVFRVRSTRFRRALLLAAMAASSLTSEYVLKGTAIGHVGLTRQLHWFLAGFLLADLHLVDWQREVRAPLGWDLVGAVGWALLLTQAHAMTRCWLVHLLPYLVLLCCAAVFRGRRLRSLFRNFWLAVIGGQCYTIYLYHYLLVRWLGGWLQSLFPGDARLLTLVVHTVVVGAATVLLSAVMFAAFERPFMHRDWPARALARLRRSGEGAPR